MDRKAEVGRYGRGGAALRAWRGARALVDCAAQAGTSSPVWIGWEQGARRPSLLNAVGLEVASRGALPIEMWGYDRDVVIRLLEFAAARRRRARPAEDA